MRDALNSGIEKPIHGVMQVKFTCRIVAAEPATFRFPAFFSEGRLLRSSNTFDAPNTPALASNGAALVHFSDRAQTEEFRSVQPVVRSTRLVVDRE